MKKLVTMFLMITFIFACDSDDDSTIVETFIPKFKFTFNWNGEAVNLSDFGTIKYTNENGEELSITRMRYLVSNFQFTDNENVITPIEGYNLADLTNQVGLTFEPSTEMTTGQYTSLTFTMGFNEQDNISSAYTDLNAVQWNWNEVWGGGYHMMQYEGRFLDPRDTDKFYALHMGTRFIAENVFEPNHFSVTLDFDENTVLDSNSEIEIQMNIAEWFKSPNLVNLNALTFPIMPNPVAQLMLNENGPSVFSVSVN